MGGVIDELVLCATPGCRRRREENGWLCEEHAAHAKPGKCTISGCRKDVTARGLCGMHYQRLRQRGDPTGPGKQNRVSTADLQKIRRAAKSTTNMELARRFGVTESTISAYRRGDRRTRG